MSTVPLVLEENIKFTLLTPILMDESKYKNRPSHSVCKASS